MKLYRVHLFRVIAFTLFFPCVLSRNACNKHLLSTVTFTYWATKKEDIGQPNRYNVDIFQGIIKSRDKPIKQLILQEYDPEKFSWYKSHAVEGAKQQSVDTRQNVVTRNQKILLISFPLLLILLLLYAYFKFTSKNEPEKTDTKNTTETKSIKPNQPIQTTQIEPEQQQQDYYITGIIQRNNTYIFYLSDGTITKTLINPNFKYFGRTYNVEVNGKWYTNYSYTSRLSPASKQ